jgi:hypothetical protein
VIANISDDLGEAGREPDGIFVFEAFLGRSSDSIFSVVFVFG